MTFKELVRELCRREGKKRQVNIAQMSETVKCLCKLIKEQPFTVMQLLLQRASK